MHYKVHVHVFENHHKTIIHSISGKRDTFHNIGKSANMKSKLKLTLNHFVIPIYDSTYPQMGW